jgi:hypothetical protein
MITYAVYDNTRLEVSAKNLTPAIAKAIDGGLLDIETTGKMLAPVNDGRLRAAIRAQRAVVKQHSITGKVSVDPRIVKYGPFVEFGGGHYGRITAMAQGVTPPDWYVYSSKLGWWAPLASCGRLDMGIGRWLEKKLNLDLQPVAGGRYDIYIKGTNTLIRKNAVAWYVRGVAHPFMTPAFLRHREQIYRELLYASERI